MTICILDLAPFIPSDSALQTSSLPDKAVQLHAAAASLSGQLAPQTARTLRQHMAVINSYYSNLIEGNHTLPHDIREAQQGQYSDNPRQRDLQQESVAHVQVQQWLDQTSRSLDWLYSPQGLQAIHQRFYQHLPKPLRWMETENGQRHEVQPGRWRTQPVKVGRHVPPDCAELPALMTSFTENFHPDRYRGEKKLIAIMAAHHRLVWIHPFLDGNGRVARLWTDAALRSAGLESVGVWCLSRGLARSAHNYKLLLANADQPRRGDRDGRGALSEAALTDFCDYMFDQALDQIDYLSRLLQLGGFKQRIEHYIQARNDHRVFGIDSDLKPVAAVILLNAFLFGELNRNQALELTGMPPRSARRLIQQLKDDGLLSETSSRSPLRWEIPEHAEPWYFPQLAPGFSGSI